jgi:hypothetical protein
VDGYPAPPERSWPARRTVLPAREPSLFEIVFHTLFQCLKSWSEKEYDNAPQREGFSYREHFCCIKGMMLQDWSIIVWRF